MRRETLVRAGRLAICALMLAAVAACAMWLRHQIAIDRCLDLGGRWQHAQGVCERTQAGGRPAA